MLTMRLFVRLLTCFLLIPSAFSASLVARGVAVGLPLGAISAPGFVFDNIGLYFSEPQGNNPSLNSMADIPVIDYSTKTRWFDNQFRFSLAPAVSWEKSKDVGHSWNPKPISFRWLGT